MSDIYPIPESNYEVLSVLEFDAFMFEPLNQDPETIDYTLHILEN